MLDWTDRHFRALARVLTRHTRLYTEMIVDQALVAGNALHLLAHDPCEHPVAAQIAGHDPRTLAMAARRVAEAGFDEVNLNVGCPSDRVQAGRFGACLMKEPDRVADCIAAISAAVACPVTVKCRIGVDEHDSPQALHRFVAGVVAAGAGTVIVHARKAWLKGLDPRANRTIPPLHPERVLALKQAFPATTVIYNGGLADVREAAAMIGRGVDGAMIGRAAYETPWCLAEADPLLFGPPAPVTTPHAAVLAYLPYIEARRREGVPLAHITRHMMGLFHGRPGARAFRRHLGEASRVRGAGPEVVQVAAALVAREPNAEFRDHAS